MNRYTFNLLEKLRKKIVWIILVLDYISLDYF